MPDEHVRYGEDATIEEPVDPKDLPSRRVDDATRTGDARHARGAGEAARNTSPVRPRDGAVEGEEG